VSITKPLLCALVVLGGCAGGQYTEAAMSAERAHSAQLSGALDAVATQTAQYQLALLQARAELAALAERCASAGVTSGDATTTTTAEAPGE
jgi:hypothetical protein